ncbi:MAG: hypothetical protein P4L84_33975 [Isosphaeraceae bacterium]|nr:hypothetical protein [Isosphaeraceae bacterium]
MSENPGPETAAGGQAVALLDSAIGALSVEGMRCPRTSRSAEPSPLILTSDDSKTAAAPVTAFDRVGLSVSIGAVRRFAMTVSGRIDGAPGSPGFDPAHAQAVCTISDRNAPGEPPLHGALKMSEDGRFTFTVLLEAWPEDRYPQGRLFVITVRARDREGALGTSTTYLRVPPPAPAPVASHSPAWPPTTASFVPDERLAAVAARPRPMALPLYAKGLHLAVKELKEERQPNLPGAPQVIP